MARKRLGPDGPGGRRDFSVGSSDRIRTENSCKYDVIEVVALAAPAWTPLHVGCDADERFSVFLFGR